MNAAPRTMRIAYDDPRAKAALDAEERLLEFYGLEMESRDVSLSRTPIRVRTMSYGTGDPLLVVPGGSGEGYQYVPLLAQLSNRRVIVINRPGAALSDFVDPRDTNLRDLAVDMIGSVMDAYGLERAAILSNSMGSLWSMWFAMTYPERVSKLVALGCPALLLDTSAPFIMRLMSVPGLNRKLVNFMVPETVEGALDGLKMMGSSEATIQKMPAILGEVQYAFSHLPTFTENWRTLSQTALTPFGAKDEYRLTPEALAHIDTPTLFVWRDNDPFGGLDVARTAVRIMPNAHLQETHAGHLPYLDQPEFCARAIDEFLG